MIVAAAVSLAAHAAESVPLRVTLRGGANGWTSAMPLQTSETRQVLAVPPSGLAQFRVSAGMPQLICGGADDVATQCRRIVPNGDTAVQFALASGRRVHARCFVGRNRAQSATVYLRLPIEGRQPALLPVRREQGELITAVKLDASGELTLDHVAPGDYTIEAHLPGGRIHEEQHVVVPEPRRDENGNVVNEIAELPDIRIAAGVEMIVEVRDRLGEPVANAAVGISQERDGATPVLFEGRAGADGRVTFTGLATDIGAQLQCSAVGHVRAEVTLPTVTPLASCTLERLATVTGTIHDDNGHALRSATVTLHRTRFTATSDDHGQFRLRDVQPGTYELRISAPQRRRATRDVLVGDGATVDAGTIELKPGTSVGGRVVEDEDGRAVPSATVTVTDPPNGDVATSDDEGKFTVVSDAESGIAIEARAPGFAAATIHVSGARHDALIIRLPRPGVLEVKSWADDGDGACAGCRIVASSATTTVAAIASADGFVRFAELAPGEYQVVREHAVAGASVVRVFGNGGVIATVKAGHTTVIELGAPASEVRVRCAPAAPADWQLSFTSRSINGTTSLDASGAFAIRKRAGETVRLALVQGSRGTRIAAIPATFSGSSFTPPVPTGALRASVVREGRALPGVLVELVDENGTVASWGWSDSNGSIVFPFLANGTYTATVEKRPVGAVTRVAGGQTADAGTLPIP